MSKTSILLHVFSQLSLADSYYQKRDEHLSFLSFLTVPVYTNHSHFVLLCKADIYKTGYIDNELKYHLQWVFSCGHGAKILNYLLKLFFIPSSHVVSWFLFRLLVCLKILNLLFLGIFVIIILVLSGWGSSFLNTKKRSDSVLIRITSMCAMVRKDIYRTEKLVEH